MPVAGTTDTYAMVGIAEDVHDLIYDISPTETPLLTMAKRIKATNRYHQWQVDSLAAAAANRQIEGDDATFASATPTTMLANRTQISRKTLIVSRTADTVRKYGRAKEFARLTVKYGKELKRDVEFALVRNQASSAGSSTAVARSSAGLEAMIVNAIHVGASDGAVAGFSNGDWVAPVDATATATMTELSLQNAMQLAWNDGGDPSVIMTNMTLKRGMRFFAGATKFDGVTVSGSKRAEGVVIAAVDSYVSDTGYHQVKLNRYMRDRVLFGIDPAHVACAWLDPIRMEKLAKTGDAEKMMMVGEYCLVATNPDAHYQVRDVVPLAS
jgi:hypothetical protein